MQELIGTSVFHFEDCIQSDTEALNRGSSWSAVDIIERVVCVQWARSICSTKAAMGRLGSARPGDQSRALHLTCSQISTGWRGWAPLFPLTSSLLSSLRILHPKKSEHHQLSKLYLALTMSIQIITQACSDPIKVPINCKILNSSRFSSNKLKGVTWNSEFRGRNWMELSS